MHPSFLDHTTVRHHALDPLLLCVPVFPCVSCVPQVGATVLLPWKDIVTSLKEYIHRDYSHRHFLGLLYGYYSVAMGYTAGKYGYLDSHGTTVGKEAGVTFLQSTDLKHLVLDVLQADALNRSSWCDCGNGGCPRCNLAVTIVLIQRSTSVSASAERILPLSEERGVHIMQLWRKKELQYAIECATCPQSDEALRDLLHNHGVRPVSSSWVNIVNEDVAHTSVRPAEAT